MLNNHSNHFCFDRVKQLIQRDIEVWITANPRLTIRLPCWLSLMAIILAIVLATMLTDTEKKSFGLAGSLLMVWSVGLSRASASEVFGIAFLVAVMSNIFLSAFLFNYTPTLINKTPPYGTTISQFNTALLTRAMLPITRLEISIVNFFYSTILVPSFIHLSFLLPFELAWITLTHFSWHDFFILNLIFFSFHLIMSAYHVFFVSLSCLIKEWSYRKRAAWLLRWLINLFLYLSCLMALIALVAIAFIPFIPFFFSFSSLSEGLMTITITATIIWGINILIQANWG